MGKLQKVQRNDRVCVFDGCGRQRVAHGHCTGHAAQVRRGQPLSPLREKRPAPIEGHSWCSKCKKQLPIEQFTEDNQRGGYQRVCNPCRAKAMEKYNAEHREQIARKMVLYCWGITEEQYAALFEAQKHLCAICGAKRRSWRNLAIDHDHKTGLIRGLLCQDCNLGMGQFQDNADLMQQAVEYLRAGGVVHDTKLRVPKKSREFKRAKERDKARAERRKK